MAGFRWKEATAAQEILGVDYDTYADLPRDQRITVLAQYEIKWRVDALTAWEHDQRRQAESKAKSKANKAKKKR